MKNVKLFGLIFGLAIIITTQPLFAQDHSKQVEEKDALKREMQDASQDVSTEINKELEQLRIEYKNASLEERKLIDDKVKALKLKYDREVKLVKESNSLEQIETKEKLEKETQQIPQGRAKFAGEKIKKGEKRLVKNEVLIKEGRMKLVLARKRLAKEKEQGKLTREELSVKEKKMATIEKKLNNHEALIQRSKTKLAQQKEALHQLSDK